MRETKVQKIARLEKKIDEQKKEMTEIKKDRKRLNYAVERLERKIQKLSAQSSKEDVKRIKELETTISTLNKEIEKLNNSIFNMQNQLLYFEKEDKEEYDYTLNNRRENLIRFHRGEIVGTLGGSFFWAHDLTPKYNPRTGETLWLKSDKSVMDFLHKNPKYTNAMEQLEAYKAEHNCDGKALMNDLQHIEWLDRIGRELLKEYIHFFY